MGAKFTNEVEKRYSRLMVIAYAGPNRSGKSTWLCQCDCGKTTIVRTWNLHAGTTRSCGCLSIKHGHATGGVTSEYRSWDDMIKRCTNPNNKAFKDYGARGITVCARWRDFTEFIQDMGLKPSPEHTIDRLNNDGNYEPGNCRWATLKQQGQNKRSNRVLICGNEAMTITDWANRLGASRQTINYHLTHKRSMEWIVDHFKDKHLPPALQLGG